MSFQSESSEKLLYLELGVKVVDFGFGGDELESTCQQLAFR